MNWTLAGVLALAVLLLGSFIWIFKKGQASGAAKKEKELTRKYNNEITRIFLEVKRGCPDMYNTIVRLYKDRGTALRDRRPG